MVHHSDTAVGEQFLPICGILRKLLLSIAYSNNEKEYLMP